MGAISTGIHLQDDFTSVMMGIVNAVNLAVSSMDDMSQAMNTGIDTSSLEGARDCLNQATIAARELSEALGNQEDVRLPSPPAWENQSNIQIFQDTGIQRLTNEMNALNEVADGVLRSQQRIDSQALDMQILPPNASWDINATSHRIEELSRQLENLQSQDITLVGDSNAEQISNQFERIREEMNDIVNLQARLDQAIEAEDLSGLNEGYNQLNNLIGQAERRARSMQQVMGGMTNIQWQSDTMPVFDGSGMERFRQEVQSTDAMLASLNTRQQQLQQTAAGMDLLPPTAVQDISAVGARIQALMERIQQIENNPLNMGTERANSELEQLRAQLGQALSAQESLNRAVDSMDIQSANSAYLQLSQTISNTERHIRDNVNEQGGFNQAINEGTENANGLISTIKGAVAAYATINTVKSAINASDELVQTSSRLNLMNDGLQSTEDLVNMAYVAAQDARGEFGTMASVIARFGNNAKEAFSSSAEVVQFAGLVQKQMTIAGASTSEASNAMLQLSQALGSGVLRGDELNSIFENAPNLIQNIADYLHVPIGKIREMAADGEISADIVKQSIFAATDQINENFNSMPLTWGQIWTSMQNTATMAFQPVLQRLNEIANSEQFQVFTTNVINAMATVAGVLLQVFNLIGTVGQFGAEHWNVLTPIIYTVIGALIAYALYLGITNAIQAISTVIKIAAAVASYAHAAATGTEASATAAATAAQYGLNTALLSCPVTWIILAIIALIAVVVALTTHLAGMGSMATTTFGTITGGVNVVIQFFKNLGVSFANISLGIVAAASALGENIMTAFHNAIKSVQVWLYDLLSTALTTIDGICEALNELPFVEFDYSGVTDAADLYATASAEAANDKREYVSIGDAFLDAAQTYDAFQDGWIDDAYREGAKWGDGVSDKISKAIKGIKTNIPDPGDYPNAVANSGNEASEIAKNTGDTAKSAQKAVQALDITGENLKYIKDMAEREYVNRFTTAKINVKQTNHNTVKKGMDLDGINDYLLSDVTQRMAATAEGVH